jgi:bifunctional non-homologous end joining protein LigD
MLATLTEARFSDAGWIFERKLDGERLLAFRKGTRVRLLSRSRQPLDRTYPEVVDALVSQAPEDFVVDGEVVAFDGRRTSFERLQGRLGISDPVRARQSGVRVFYYLFDVVHLEGHDTTALAVRDRKALLRTALVFTGPLRYTTHRNASGERFFEDACRWGWEGLIAKRAASPYVGRRSPDWLKMKCSASQELVIGGFTDPAGSRVGFGALLVGYFDGQRLRYAGRVGTGYTRDVLLELRRDLGSLEVATSPFAERVTGARGVHWVRPQLVAEVAFSEWTADGKLRHPRFEGLRTDKAARDVVRERPRPPARVRGAR